MALIIDLDIDKCSACGACAVACMDQNDIDTQRCEAPFRVVFDLEQKDEKGQYRYTYMATACMHCADAPCVTACPCGCLSKDPATGLTLYDNTRCWDILKNAIDAAMTLTMTPQEALAQAQAEVDQVLADYQ